MEQNKKNIDKRRELPINHNGKIAFIGMSPIDIKQNDFEDFKKIIFPLPNFTALYLSISDKNFKVASDLHENIIDSAILKTKNYELSEENEPLFYDFCEALFTSVIFAFAGVECFINNLIPNYIILIKKKTETNLQLQSKNFIEKYVTLNEKIKIILPKVYKYGFNANKLECWEDFKKLEKFRNSLIHFKSNEIEGSKLENAKLIGEIWNGVYKSDVIESAKKMIEYHVKKVPNAPGFPREFSESTISSDKYFLHFSRKEFNENNKFKILFQDEEGFMKFINMYNLDKERDFKKFLSILNNE